MKLLLVIVVGDWCRMVNHDLMNEEGPTLLEELVDHRKYDCWQKNEDKNVLAYGVGPVGKETIRACVAIKTDDFFLKTSCEGDTHQEALKNLVDEFQDLIKSYFGTIHPDEIEGPDSIWGTTSLDF